MAEPEEAQLDTDQKIRRGVLRTLTNGTLLLLALAVIGGWISTGVYKLELGEEAVIFRLGKHHRTVKREGLNWHLPEPIEYHTPVNTRGLRTEVFGMLGDALQHEGEGAGRGLFIQTADKNIVAATFELQYTLEDAYSYRFGMVDPRAVLHEATQASVRKVIGGMLVDDVLLKRRGEVQIAARENLDATLADYFAKSTQTSAFRIEKINLLTVHPPDEVRNAFKEVEAARQDEERSVSKAQGDEQEILERARAEAAELRERSEAYKEAKVLESEGEAKRFEALLAEYRRAPEVTRRRLYLETMETVMPRVEKMIVEPDTVSVMPLMPIPTRTPPVAAPPPPPPQAGGAAGEQEAKQP